MQLPHNPRPERCRMSTSVNEESQIPPILEVNTDSKLPSSIKLIIEFQVHLCRNKPTSSETIRRQPSCPMLVERRSGQFAIMQHESPAALYLRAKFLHVAFVFARKKCQWHDTTDMHLRAIYMHIQLQLCTNGLDVLETLLIIGSCTTNPDLHFMFDKSTRDFAERANNAFEG